MTRPPKTPAALSKSESTKAHVLEVALRLFRENGFEKTTMRDIAGAAGLSLGAAYYYYPSKDAIVLAYYATRIEAHGQRARVVFAKSQDLSERLSAAFDLKLDLLKDDRKLLGALFRSLGDPSDVSLFSPTNTAIRDASLSVFREAIAPAGLSAELLDMTALLLWTAHLGVTLYFLNDTSPKAAKTRGLAKDIVNLVAPLLPILPLLPGAESLLGAVREMLTRAGLLRER